MNTLKLALTAGVAALCLAAEAQAQPGAVPTDHAAVPPQGQTPDNPTAPGTAAGAPTATPVQATGGAQLQEVVVTANRRSENLQNVPITVNAVSGAALANAGVTNLQDLAVVVPGLNVNNDSGYLNTHLRGVGSTTPGPGIESPVAVYVDGVYYANTQGVNLDFVDVNQVEVLKGPQGTLFGRNATGGLIQVTTKDPSQTPALDVDLGYGNYNTSRGDLYAAGGIAPNLAGSIAGDVTHQGDGFGKNFYSGADVNKVEIDLQLRSKLVWTPSEGTKITSILDYAQVRASDEALRVPPGTLPAAPTGPSYGGSPWDIDVNLQPLYMVKTGGASIRLDQSLPFARLMNIVAYRYTYGATHLDVDETATPSEAILFHQDEHQVTEELQLQSLPASWIKWTGGVFYFNDLARVNPLNVQLGPTPALNPDFPINNIFAYGTQNTESVSGYGQASAEILPKTNLTFGARYTYETRSLLGTQTLDVGEHPVVFLPQVDESKAFYRPTFRVALDHRFSPLLLTYVSFNTGFKSGGFNPTAIETPAFRPETIDAYEAGVKTNLLGNRIRADLSYFYYDYNEIQVQKLLNGTTSIINGAGAHISGVDLDVAAKVTSALNVHGGLEYLHDRFSSFPNAPLSSASGLVPVTTGSAAGNRLPLAPDAVVDLGADYVASDLLGGDATLSVAYLFNTGYFLEPDNVLHQADYSSLNASAKWKSRSGRYTVRVYGNNLTDAVIVGFGTTETSGTHGEQFQPPRTYGFTVGYHY